MSTLPPEFHQKKETMPSIDDHTLDFCVDFEGQFLEIGLDRKCVMSRAII
jgi:hypothetical protein